MTAYIVSVLMVVLGGVALLAGVLMGVRPSADYVVEAGFALFALAAAVFVVSVVAGLAREFRETA